MRPPVSIEVCFTVSLEENNERIDAIVRELIYAYQWVHIGNSDIEPMP